MNQRFSLPSHQSPPSTRGRDANLRGAAARTLSIVLAVIMLTPASPAAACPTLSGLTTPSEVTDFNVTGAVSYQGLDPLVKQQNLASRVRTHPYEGGSVRGGDYSVVAVDAEMYNELKNSDSDTGPAGRRSKKTKKFPGGTVNKEVNDMNTTLKGKKRFVAGHLVNHEFGGNFVDRNNFTTITSKTNGLMKNNSEKLGKQLMGEIHSQYYDGASKYKNAWVGQNSSGTLKYKPGILYETEIPDTQTVRSYETANGKGSLINNGITDAEKGRLASRLRTRIRFIVHEYTIDGGGNASATGNWFDMPQEAFDQYRAKSGVTLPTDESVDFMNVTNEPYGSGGVQLTWEYWNFDLDPAN